MKGDSREIDNVDSRLDSGECKLNNDEEGVKSVEVKVEDEERRVEVIENCDIKYRVWRKVKYGKKGDEGLYL